MIIMFFIEQLITDKLLTHLGLPDFKIRHVNNIYRCYFDNGIVISCNIDITKFLFESEYLNDVVDGIYNRYLDESRIMECGMV